MNNNLQNEFYISDFSQAVLQKDGICRDLTAAAWELADYETTDIKGTMLFSRKNNLPDTVTVNPDLKGWYRIYACLFSGEPFRSLLSLKLSGDESPSFMTQGNTWKDGEKWCWSPMERCEEMYWKSADLTGMTIDIGKPAGAREYRIGLMWLKFVPMTDAEIGNLTAVQRANPGVHGLHAHCDSDWLMMLNTPPSQTEYAMPVEEISHSDVEVFSMEIPGFVSDYSSRIPLLDTPCKALFDRTLVNAVDMYQHRAEIVADYARRAENAGFRLYYAQRMGLSNFTLGMDKTNCYDGLAFVNAHPEWMCQDRDGECVPFLSYAYPEVADYMIQVCLQAVECGFHGVTLIWIRGIQVLFEPPVRRRFAEEYPGIDPATLPLNDPRISRIRCSFITDFHRRLRRAFDDYSRKHDREHLGINSIVCYTLEDNRIYGLDPTTWARENLVDSIVVGNMKLWEENNDSMDDDHPDFISVQKYAECKKHGRYAPVSREFSNDISLKLQAVNDFIPLMKETNIRIYFEMPWENTMTPGEMRDYALKLYQAGAQNLSLWDCFRLRVIYRPEWMAVARAGHTDILASLPNSDDGYRKLHRIISLNGQSLAAYHPSWRG